MRQRSTGIRVSLWASKLSRKSFRICSLRDTQGNDHHKTLQLYTMMLVNDAVPQQMGLPGTCARLCRAHSDSSSMAVKEETLRTPAHINKIRWVIAAVPSGTIPPAQPGQFLVLERLGQAFEVFLLVR